MNWSNSIFVLIGCLYTAFSALILDEQLLKGYVYQNPTQNVLEFTHYYSNYMDYFEYLIFLVSRDQISETEEFVKQNFGKLDRLQEVYISVLEEAPGHWQHNKVLRTFNYEPFYQMQCWKLVDAYYKPAGVKNEMEEKKSIAAATESGSCTLKERWSRFVWTEQEKQETIAESVHGMPENAIFLQLAYRKGACVVDAISLDKREPVHTFDVDKDGNLLHRNVAVYSVNSVSRMLDREVLINLPEFENYLLHSKPKLSSIQYNQGALIRVPKQYSVRLAESRKKRCVYVLVYRKKELITLLSSELKFQCLRHPSITNNCVTIENDEKQLYCSPVDLEIRYGITLKREELSK